MKKLLSVAMISAVLGTSAFAGKITYLGQKETTLSVQMKYIDIKDSGLDSGIVYGLSYVMHKDLGQEGAWGMRYGFEFNYGKMDFSDKSGDTTYTEFSWIITPTYTFNFGGRVYFGGKVGYLGFSDYITSNSDSKNGDVLAGIVGAEYLVAKYIVVGVKVEIGSTYIDVDSYSTTIFDGYIGYKFY